MAIKYEYYDVGDDTHSVTYGIYWRAQTFTPSLTHTITSVKLLLYRIGNPGTLTVSIRAVDGSGHPTDEDLCSGTTNGNNLPTESPYEWREITLGAGTELDADTMYAIILRAPDGTANNEVEWRLDTEGAYAGGNTETSADSGGSWTTWADYDYMFEEWGEPLYTLHEWEGSDSIALTDTLIKNPIKVLADGIALSDVLIKNPIKTLVDGIAFADVLVKYKIMLRTFTDSIAFTDTLEKWWTQHYERVFTDGIALTDILAKTTMKVFSDGIKFADCLTRWRWLTAIRNLTRPRCPQPSVREQDKIDDGNVG